MKDEKKEARVFPASAGVILEWMSARGIDARFPRIRGGDPVKLVSVPDFMTFSPHPRG